MPSKLLKLVSKEADIWSATGTHEVNVDIPSGIDFCNLDQTMILLEVRVDNTEIQAVGGVRPVSIGFARDAPEYDSDCFIRNCHFESEVAGRFDSMEEPNLLNQNLDFYSQTTEGKKSATSYNGSFLQDEYGFLRSTFRQLNKLSTPGQVLSAQNPGDVSTELKATLMIPLKKIIPFARNMSFYPARMMGTTRLHLEFENDLKTLVYYADDERVFKTLAVPAAAADDRNTLILADRFHDPDACSLYMTEPVQVSFSTYAGGGSVGDFTYYTQTNPPTLPPAPLAGFDPVNLVPGTYSIDPANITGGSGTDAEVDVIVSQPLELIVTNMTIASPSVVTILGSTVQLNENQQVFLTNIDYSVTGVPVADVGVKYTIRNLTNNSFELFDETNTVPINVTAFAVALLGRVQFPIGPIQRVEVLFTELGDDYLPGDVLEIDDVHFGGLNGENDLYIDILSIDLPPTVQVLNTVITGLTHDLRSNTVTVTLRDQLPDSAVVNDYGDVTIRMLEANVGASPPDWAIDKVFLTVPQLFPPKATVDSFMNNIRQNGIVLPWFTFIREPQQVLASTKFDRQFTLPPNTGNVICLTPNNTLVSENDNVNNFRFRINGQDASTYDIVYQSPFYYDAIVESWTNMGKTLNNLDENRNEDVPVFAEPPMILPTVVPLLPEPGFFSLSIRANANMTQKNLFAYKQVQRTLKLTANEISIE